MRELPKMRELIESDLRKVESIDLGGGWSVSGGFSTDPPDEEPTSGNGEVILTLTLTHDGEEMSTLAVRGGPETKDRKGITPLDRIKAWDDFWYESTEGGHHPGRSWLNVVMRRRNKETLHAFLEDMADKDPIGARVIQCALEAGQITENKLLGLIAEVVQGVKSKGEERE